MSLLSFSDHCNVNCDDGDDNVDILQQEFRYNSWTALHRLVTEDLLLITEEFLKLGLNLRRTGNCRLSGKRQGRNLKINISEITLMKTSIYI
jgi:hypothetical protein